jgi:L-glyceraldehyde 3-phosphate reductase
VATSALRVTPGFFAFHILLRGKPWRMSGYAPDPQRYEAITYARCGRSGLKLPRISLGLWHNFGGMDPIANQRALLRRSFDLGITHFDLANNYGPPPGSAEENFGRLLREDFAAHRDELIISTKAGYHMWPGPYGEWGSRKNLLASLDQSLKRLGLPYVDIFYHHRPDPDTPMEESLTAVADAVRSGRALYAGISNYNAAQTRQAAAILKNLGVPLLIHQPKYNLFNRWVEPELLSALTEVGAGCIPFSPLAQGLLTNRYLAGLPTDSRAVKSGVFLSTMPRPVTLFTGQWADLPLEKLAPLARKWATTASSSPAGATTSMLMPPLRPRNTGGEVGNCWRTTASPATPSPATSSARPSAI